MENYLFIIDIGVLIGIWIMIFNFVSLLNKCKEMIIKIQYLESICYQTIETCKSLDENSKQELLSAIKELKKDKLDLKEMKRKTQKAFFKGYATRKGEEK